MTSRPQANLQNVPHATPVTSFAYRSDRSFQLDSIVERLAWAAVHTAPQPYRVDVADARDGQLGGNKPLPGKLAIPLPAVAPTGVGTCAPSTVLQGVIIVCGMATLTVLFVVKANASVLFHGDPFLFFYTYFITVFELSRVVAAMAFMRTTREIERMSGYDFYEPTITFVIPCKNEAAAIERTVSNCFAAEYPADKVEVIVVNDGSTDGTIGVLRRLEHTYPTLVVVDWKENKGKRHGMAEGFKRATGEVAIQLDSDSFIEPSSIRHLVRPFANPSIGAVCAHADPLNADDNLLTKMQSAYYFMSFRILKAAESTFLTVFCCSGCSSAYRKSVVLPIIDTWLGERFLGKPTTWGDDRALTNWVLRLGYDTIYSDKAQARTIVPTSLKQLLKQQVRWKKGWFVNSVNIAGFILRKRPFVALTYFLPLIFLTLMTPFMAGKAILYGLLVAHTLPVTYFFGVLLMATIVMLYYRWISRDNKYWPFVLLWAAFNSLVLSTVLFYAVLRLNDRGWGTR